MSVTLVIPQPLLDEMAAEARLSVESAAVLLVSRVTLKTGCVRLLVRAVRWVPAASYIRREADGLTIAADGYVPFLAEAAATGCVCIWMHTHPGMMGIPRPSVHDSIVDDQICELFRIRSDSDFYGTLIVSPASDGVAFTGYIQLLGMPRRMIDKVWAVGERIRLLVPYGSTEPPLTIGDDRNVRAFGPSAQQTLRRIWASVVGCGGTGSAVAEQLVRLGVRKLTLIDPDVLSESNLTRVYGSGRADIGREKVHVLRDHLARIAPDLSCEVLSSSVTDQNTALSLLPSDVVFGCTDDNAGRLVLSRFASYLCCPVFDCGVLIDSDGAGSIRGIFGRVTYLGPTAPCLVCRNRVDLRRAAAEMLAAAERERLEHEGYAPALGGVEPAVVTYTTLVAASAVSEFLDRLIGYGPSDQSTELLIRFHDKEMSSNRLKPVGGHYCDPRAGRIGLGVTTPFLDQSWSS